MRHHTRIGCRSIRMHLLFRLRCSRCCAQQNAQTHTFFGVFRNTKTVCSPHCVCTFTPHSPIYALTVGKVASAFYLLHALLLQIHSRVALTSSRHVLPCPPTPTPSRSHRVTAAEIIQLNLHEYRVSPCSVYHIKYILHMRTLSQMYSFTSCECVLYSCAHPRTITEKPTNVIIVMLHKWFCIYFLFLFVCLAMFCSVLASAQLWASTHNLMTMILAYVHRMSICEHDVDDDNNADDHIISGLQLNSERRYVTTTWHDVAHSRLTRERETTVVCDCCITALSILTLWKSTITCSHADTIAQRTEERKKSAHAKLTIWFWSFPIKGLHACILH